jgi:hypothetical protein
VNLGQPDASVPANGRDVHHVWRHHSAGRCARYSLVTAEFLTRASKLGERDVLQTLEDIALCRGPQKQINR